MSSTELSLSASRLPGPREAAAGRAVRMLVRGPAVPRARAWRLVGDTDWLNQMAGNGAVLSMELQAQRDGLPVMSGFLAGPMGMRMPFEEAYTSWVRGEAFRQVRTVRSPILKQTDYEARLLTEGSLVRPEISLTLHVALPALPVAQMQIRGIARSWQAALDALSAPPKAVRPLPDGARFALDRWAQVSDPDVVAHIEEHLSTAHPTELRQLRGYALAQRWGMDRDLVLNALLAGVEAGALELYWSVRCVRCYGEVAASTTLSDIADHATCSACRIDFQSDLGENVEVLFAPHPSVLTRTTERFCTMYPGGAPSQYAVFTLPEGGQQEATIELPTGEWRLGPGGDRPDASVVVREGAHSGPIAWRASAAGEAQLTAPGRVPLSFENDGPGRARVYLTRVGGEDERIPAARLTTLPGFRKRMGHQVLAPNTRISVRSVALVFTDLSDSTAMYEEMGDAGAYALVRDHFAVLEAVVSAEGGTVVKTIGDAVMAAFHDGPTALRAALSMQAAFNTWIEQRGLQVAPRLKVGLHVGPVLAVHTDAAGIDYFGGTVNTAARAQGVAGSGEVVWTPAIDADPRVATIVEATGLPTVYVERQLKGLKGEMRLTKLGTLSGRGASKG
jgi:adenylate cyclase